MIKTKELKAKDSIKVLHKKIKTLETRLGILEDMEEIKKLQKIYGYYLDNKLWDEIVDLFSDNTESVELGGRGLYLGKKGVEILFKKVIGGGKYGRQPGELHNHLQVQGVVNVKPDGKKANGRWRAFAQITAALSKGVQAAWIEGVYENEYAKEDGKWKFKKMHWYLTFYTPYEDGWGKTASRGVGPSTEFPPDKPPTVHEPYPSNYVVPFHYKHPITGK
jgi:hypothetical protein